MSIWGPGTAENDDAADWLADLEDAPDIEPVRSAIREIADSAHAGYREVTECCEAIAAAQVICELLGEPGAAPVLELEENDRASLQVALEKMPIRSRLRLLRDALFSVQFIVGDSQNSELRQLWEEDEVDYDDWIAANADLTARLRRLEANAG